MNRASICVAALLLAPLSCFADGWTNSLHIKDVYIYGSSDTILVAVDETQVYDTANNCTGNTWSLVTTDAGRRQRMYAALLTAQATGRTVKLWWAAGCGSSNSHQATVVRIERD